MQRSVAVRLCALLAAAAALASAPAGARAEGEEEKAEPSPAGTGEAPKAEAPAARGGARNVWWNEPTFVEALSLSEEQRTKADAFLKAYRETLEGPQGGAGVEVFHQALAKGDWARARTELDALSAQAAVPVRSRGELKLNVLKLLSDEQRAKLTEKFPRLVSHPWVRPPRRGVQRGR